jgi:hypothetical protein
MGIQLAFRRTADLVWPYVKTAAVPRKKLPMIVERDGGFVPGFGTTVQGRGIASRGGSHLGFPCCSCVFPTLGKRPMGGGGWRFRPPRPGKFRFL